LAPNFEIPGKKFQKFQLFKPQPFLIGINSTHNQAVATAQMSSETAPVSKPVYNYWDNKRVPAAVYEN